LALSVLDCAWADPRCGNSRSVCGAAPAAATSRQGFLHSVYFACYRSADVYLQECLMGASLSLSVSCSLFFCLSVSVSLFPWIVHSLVSPSLFLSGPPISLSLILPLSPSPLLLSF